MTNLLARVSRSMPAVAPFPTWILSLLLWVHSFLGKTMSVPGSQPRRSAHMHAMCFVFVTIFWLQQSFWSSRRVVGRSLPHCVQGETCPGVLRWCSPVVTAQAMILFSCHKCDHKVNISNILVWFLGDWTLLGCTTCTPSIGIAKRFTGLGMWTLVTTKWPLDEIHA
jgi:hypothetical protein